MTQEGKHSAVDGCFIPASEHMSSSRLALPEYCCAVVNIMWLVTTMALPPALKMPSLQTERTFDTVGSQVPVFTSLSDGQGFWKKSIAKLSWQNLQLDCTPAISMRLIHVDVCCIPSSPLQNQRRRQGFAKRLQNLRDTFEQNHQQLQAKSGLR